MEQREIVCLDCGGRELPTDCLPHDRGWRVTLVSTPAEAQRLIEENDIRVALANFGSNFDEICKAQILEELFENTPRVGWLAIVESAVVKDDFISGLIATYFHDYLTIPLIPDHLLQSVGHAYGMATLCLTPSEPSTDIAKTDIEGLPHTMLARSQTMRQAVRALGKCAKARAPVTITGESGTGKELAALAIHRQSSQASGPFIAVNCGAIPENLIQAELFGYTKGAFTGADRDKTGRIEAARGGTLFLDEIGDLSLGLQVNLLRFLQEGVIEKVGAPRPIPVETRVIAATHKNLEEALENGEFRHDLYYRLNVLHVHLPALRDRGEDILALANAYLAHFSGLAHGRATEFSPRALNVINRYHWPGNIRELINRIQRAVVMSERQLLTPADLGLDRRSALRAPKTLDQARGEAEKDALSRSLCRSGHNIAETARNLGVSRLTVYRLIEKHGMDMNQGVGRIQ